MDLIADILLVSAASAAAFYCFVLSRRLNKFNDLEKGVGGAVAVLSTQVEELKNTLEAAQDTAANSAETLTDLNIRAETTSKRLELQMAALSDMPQSDAPETKIDPEPTTTPESTGNLMFKRHASGDK